MSDLRLPGECEHYLLPDDCRFGCAPNAKESRTELDAARARIAELELLGAGVREDIHQAALNRAARAEARAESAEARVKELERLTEHVSDINEALVGGDPKYAGWKRDDAVRDMFSRAESAERALAEAREDAMQTEARLVAISDERGTLRAELAEARAQNAALDDIIFDAWGIIANAGRGNWTLEHPEWQEAAARWRDTKFHPSLKSNPGAPILAALRMAEEALEKLKGAHTNGDTEDGENMPVIRAALAKIREVTG